jgi:hypothetical protein
MPWPTGKPHEKGVKKTPQKPVDTNMPTSAVCGKCGANAPARRDGSGQPMAHYDARVENAHVTQTYCK